MDARDKPGHDDRIGARQFPRLLVMPGLDPGIHGQSAICAAAPWTTGSSPVVTRGDGAAVPFSFVIAGLGPAIREGRSAKGGANGPVDHWQARTPASQRAGPQRCKSPWLPGSGPGLTRVLMRGGATPRRPRAGGDPLGPCGICGAELAADAPMDSRLRGNDGKNLSPPPEPPLSCAHLPRRGGVIRIR